MALPVGNAALRWVGCVGLWKAVQYAIWEEKQ